MNYIALLDYDHLDNALFLKSFAGALSVQQNTRGIILHGDSLYTERLIQTGMMRGDAKRRSIKDLNRRLVSLMADNGVAAIGLNAYQRRMVSLDGASLRFKHELLTNFPVGTHLLLSNLIDDQSSGEASVYSLSGLGSRLFDELNLEEIIVFSRDEADEIMTGNLPQSLSYDELEGDIKQRTVPDDLHDLPAPFRLATTRTFKNLPEVKGMTLVRPVGE